MVYRGKGTAEPYWPQIVPYSLFIIIFLSVSVEAKEIWSETVAERKKYLLRYTFDVDRGSQKKSI